jgi:aspartate carbamoyltransferase regulatory subunit
MPSIRDKKTVEITLKCNYCDHTFPYTIECNQAIPLKAIRNNFHFTESGKKLSEKPELITIYTQCPNSECKKPLKFQIDERKICSD